ncbi:MAG TPA: CoA pyrophosphatase [Hyphomicrobiales bacterium]|nr:CoA pyrophosphatase [Hyphomicrobiales bacterium]
MTAAPPFSLADFCARATERLLHEPPDPAAPAGGNITPMPAVATERAAAVLVPIVSRPEPTVLLTQRTAHLSSHAGQISFPGGKIEPDDASPLAAALREAEEEIGLDRAHVAPLGFLDAVVTGTGYRIVPVVGLVRPDHALMLNPGEVAEAFELPLVFAMTPENHLRHSRLFNGVERSFNAIPWQQRYIWGATARMLKNLYDRLYGPAGTLP